jgi:hypothetical protein
MAFLGFRGDTPFKDELAFRAHLATLLRLENVGLLLGAGASVPAGGKTMWTLWSDFVNASPDDAKWLLEQGFIDKSSLATEPKRVVPNIETLGDTLEIARAEWRRQNRAELPVLEKANAQLTRAFIRAATLQESWWQAAGGAEADNEQLQHHRSILQKLVAARQPGQAAPWVFTTNYDLAIEWAAESIDLQVVNGFLGIHGRRFSPRASTLALETYKPGGRLGSGFTTFTWQSSTALSAGEKTAPKSMRFKRE